jgi:hypothetical protein
VRKRRGIEDNKVQYLQIRGDKGGGDKAGAWVLEGSAKKTIGVVIAKVKEAIPAGVCPW